MNGEKGILFTQGNEACVRGALYAGLRFFAGYPITPSTEVAELLSEELPHVGGRFIQMEDEISSLCAVCAASVLAGWMLGMYLRTDYGGWGVVTVILLALCRGRDGGWLAMLAGLVCINGVCLAGQVIHLGPLGFPMQLLAALAIVPISLYDGRRGPGGRGVQLAFYAFYPVHMLVLALLAQFLS